MKQEIKYTIIMPAYNEEKTIEKMIKKIQEAFHNNNYELIIVNDGSTDRTHEIVSFYAKTHPHIRYIYYEENKGKGFAIRKGIYEARGKYIGIQDADLEYDPEELKKLFKISEITGYIVYGSRMLGKIKNMKWYIKTGNKFLSLIFSLFYGQRITDVETCYKVGPSTVFKSLNLNSNNFDIEIEITAKILRKGFFILEVPISYTGRDKKEKKLKPIKDGFHALYKIIYYRMARER